MFFTSCSPQILWHGVLLQDLSTRLCFFFVERNIEYTIETQQAGGRNYQRRKINLGFFSLFIFDKSYMSWQLAHKF